MRFISSWRIRAGTAKIATKVLAGEPSGPTSLDEACGLNEPLSQADEILEKQSDEGDDRNDWDSASNASSTSSSHAGVTYDENREFNVLLHDRISIQ